MTRPFKFLIGLLLLPICVACTGTFWQLICILWQSPIRIPLLQLGALLGGIVLWVVIFFCLPPFTRTYVLGHELTHALWSMLFGGRASHLRVSEKGGSVRVSKVNFLVTLSPYFFPLYTGIILLIWLALRLFWSGAENWAPLFLFLAGFTWAFHITFTIRFLNWRQPDVKEQGRLFSYTLIYAINLFSITAALIPLSTWSFPEAIGTFLQWMWFQIDMMTHQGHVLWSWLSMWRT